MEPTGEQPDRSDSRTSLPRSRPESFTGPVQRRPPLSRASAPQPMARQQLPTDSPQPNVNLTPPEPVQYQQSAVAPEPVAASSPEPVMQMPQPESLAPPVQAQEATPPVSEQQSVETQPAADPQERPLAQAIDFTPPPKQKKRRWMYPALAVVAVLIVGFGVFSYVKVQAAKNNPDNVMKNALSNALSLSTVQGTAKSQETTVTTQYDFTNSKNPVVSTASSVTSPKGQVMIGGNGNIKDTYVNYTSLPKTVPANISKQMSNTWVQVRQDGELPKNVPDIVIKASDPRYQAFGPIVMGNFEGKTKDQLVDFMLKNKVYGYDAAKVKKEKLGEETVFVFPIKLDVSFLKVASQSAAVNIGLEPGQIQLATDAMESLRDANVTLYINAGDNTFARMYISKDGVAKTIDLSGYKETKLPGAPQTRLTWQGFTPLQNQIEAQTSLTKSPY